MINTKSSTEVALLREAGRVNALTHSAVRERLASGICTAELDHIAAATMQKYGGHSAFKGLRDFPRHICISVNDEVGHGIPGHRMLQTGDLVKVDIGVEFRGYFSDCAWTHIIGTAPPDVMVLVSTTKRALRNGIAAMAPERRLSDISHCIERTVAHSGFRVVRTAFSHGIGQRLHEDPRIPNFGPMNRGPRMREGMVLAIEPVVTNGSRFTRTLADGWTDVTVDGSLGAHFEHTVLLTEHGPEILTALEPEPVSPNIVFRPMGDADQSAILQLASRQMNSILIEAWGRPVQSPDIVEIAGATTTVMETPDARLIGFYTHKITDNALHLSVIVIDAPFQGQGIGTTVMKRLSQLALSFGLPFVELCVQTNNEKAIGFYRKLGFYPCGNPYFNTIAMRLKVKE